jgi:hypothetical protein
MGDELGEWPIRATSTAVTPPISAAAIVPSKAIQALVSRFLEGFSASGSTVLCAAWPLWSGAVELAALTVEGFVASDPAALCEGAAGSGGSCCVLIHEVCPTYPPLVTPRY